MWKKDEFGSVFTESLPDGWSAAVWSDFFINDRFLVNMPFLALRKSLGRYYGYRTRDYRLNNDFYMSVATGLVFIQKKSD